MSPTGLTDLLCSLMNFEFQYDMTLLKILLMLHDIFTIMNFVLILYKYQISHFSNGFEYIPNYPTVKPVKYINGFYINFTWKNVSGQIMQLYIFICMKSQNLDVKPLKYC